MLSGRGRLDLLGYMQPDAAGGSVDYAHRITDSLSAFAKGWGGARRGADSAWQPDYGAFAGLRWEW